MRYLLVALIASLAYGETIFPSRLGGINYYGTSTVHVGAYEWPPWEPLSVIGSSGVLTARADYVVSGASGDTLTTSNPIYSWGGLPNGTPIKFVTMSIAMGTDALPTRVVSTATMPTSTPQVLSWKQDHNVQYYACSWSGATFKVSLSAACGSFVSFSTAGSGTWGISFAGHIQCVSPLMKVVGDGNKATFDPATDTLTFLAPHGLTNANTRVLHSTGDLPTGLRNFTQSRFIQNPLDVLTTTTLRLWDVSWNHAKTSPAQLLNGTDAGTGQLYLFSLVSTSGPLYWDDIRGYPAGTTLVFREDTDQMSPLSYNLFASPYDGLPRVEQGLSGVAMYAKVPAISAAGTSTIEIDTSESSTPGTNAATFSMTLNKVAVSAFSKIGPTSYPAIPGFDASSAFDPTKTYRNWEYLMTSADHGGGAEVGGSGTGVQPFPRCTNRTDPKMPIAINPPYRPQAAAPPVTVTQWVQSGNTATITAPSNGLVAGNKFIMAGGASPKMNHMFQASTVVGDVITADTLTGPSLDTPPQDGSIPAGTYAATIDVTQIADAVNTATVTTDVPHGRIVGDQVTIAGVTGGGTGLNGTFTIGTVGSTTTFTYTSAGVSDTTYNNAGITSTAVVPTVMTITRVAASGWTAADVTTRVVNHNFGTQTGLREVCYQGDDDDDLGSRILAVDSIDRTDNSTTFNFASTSQVRCDVSVIANETATNGNLATPYRLSFRDPGSQVWFYMRQTPFEIAKYTGDPTWANCGIYTADSWMRYLGSNQPAAYYNPDVLYSAYAWTHNPVYKNRLKKQLVLATGYRGEVHDLYSREHNWKCVQRLDAMQSSGDIDYNVQYFMSSLFGMYYANATVHDERTFLEPFITGFQAQLLIRWFLLTHDSRIPGAIKTGLELYYSRDYQVDKQPVTQIVVSSTGTVGNITMTDWSTAGIGSRIRLSGLTGGATALNGVNVTGTNITGTYNNSLAAYAPGAVLRVNMTGTGIADGTYNNVGILMTTYEHHYNPEPWGPGGKTGNVGKLNGQDPGFRCGVNCDGWSDTNLHAFMAPAYAWYFRLTGDTTIRDKGDELFSIMSVGSSDFYFAKSYSQAYYWTFDYVRWRRGEQVAY